MNLVALQPKHILGALGGVLAAYLIVLPWFWPLPEVSARIPESVPLGQDLEIPITLSAWHSNVDVYLVRFYVDYYGSTAKGEEGLFYPVPVLERKARRFRGAWGHNHLTRPWSETFAVTVPLRQFAEQKLLGPGMLTGKVDVSFNYHPGFVQRMPYPVDQTRQAMLSVPFQIAVTE